MGIPSFRERLPHIPILQNHTSIRNQYPPCPTMRGIFLCFSYFVPTSRCFFLSSLVYSEQLRGTSRSGGVKPRQ